LFRKWAIRAIFVVVVVVILFPEKVHTQLNERRDLVDHHKTVSGLVALLVLFWGTQTSVHRSPVLSHGRRAQKTNKTKQPKHKMAVFSTSPATN
jgi:hypothetical protein